MSGHDGSGDVVQRGLRPVPFPRRDVLEEWLDRRSGERRATDRRKDTELRRPPVEDRAALRDACHDLRQPIAAAQMLAAGLRAGTCADPQAQERLFLLESQLLRMSDIVLQLLEPPPPVAVDVGQLVLDAVLVARQVSDVDIEVLVQGPVLATADAVLLGRALTNLIDNACRIAGPERRVRVSAWSGADGPRLAVEDAGPAADPTGGRVAPSGGHGLGLLITASVMRRLGGEVTTGRSSLGGLHVELCLPPVVETARCGGLE